MNLINAFFNVLTGNVQRSYELNISLSGMEDYHTRLIHSNRDSYIAAQELNQKACLGSSKRLKKEEWASLFRKNIKKAYVNQQRIVP